MATGSVARIVTNAMRGGYDDNRNNGDNLKLSFAGATEMPRIIIAHELLGNIFFAHELHEFSCKRVQNRTCSSYAERSRKCQRNGHEGYALREMATGSVARIVTNAMRAD